VKYRQYSTPGVLDAAVPTRIPAQPGTYRIIAVTVTVTAAAAAGSSRSTALIVEYAGVATVWRSPAATVADNSGAAITWADLGSDADHPDATNGTHYITAPAPRFWITAQMTVGVHMANAFAGDTWSSISWLIEDI